MNRVAHFEKVSLAQFTLDCKNNGIDTDHIEEVYEKIQLPQRATKQSAGYDFFAPFDIVLRPGSTCLIPSGIRARMEDGYVLMIFPRSGLGFKYRLQLNNTVGIIDADYYHAANEGHIMFRLTNDTHEGKMLHIEAGRGMVQGIFVPFGITDDDEADGLRTGGFGSTGK